MKSTSFAPDQQVGRYTIRKLLAQGGMAEVYKVDQELGAGIVRPVALKVIRPEYSSSPDFREMFLDEARCACGLSHPNIVQIFDVGEVEGLLYMAMELVAGETLATVNRTLREHHDKFTDEALYAIGIYCASALEAVHALKVHDSPVKLVHRDVSPHNLLLSSQGALKLIDFGIAKAATNRNLTSPGVTKGKAGYFSPEQAMGKPLDGRSDLFSLGVTLYKLAYGSTPFDHHATHAERNGALVRGLWKPLEEVTPGLSPGLYEVVRRSMMLKPEERYSSASEMREALEAAAFSSGLRIGTKSLLGYVTDDGAITTVPTGTRAVSTSGLAPTRIADTRASETRAAETRAENTDATDRPKARTVSAGEVPTRAERVPSRPKTIPLAPPARGPAAADQRERITDKVHERPKQKPSQRIGLRAAVFGAALLAGVGLTLLLLPSGQAEPPAPVAAAPGPRTVLSAQPPSAHEPAPLPPNPAPAPPAPVEEKPTPPEEPGEVDVTVAVRPAHDAPSKEPAAKAALTKRPKSVVAPKEKPEAAEAIPQGQGQLRISTAPSNVVSRVTVDKSDWGPAPVNQKISSGRYVVSVVLPDGKRSPEWVGAVMPDVTTVLIYDINAGKWQRRQ